MASPRAHAVGTSTTTTTIAATMALLFAAGCGGAPTLSQGVYRDGDLVFALDAPAGWDGLSVTRARHLAWGRGGAMIQVHAACRPSLDIPLTALTNHLLIGFTERELVEQTLLPMDGREALRTHLRAKLDGVPRELLLQVLKKDTCVYDFALVAPPGEPFAAVRPTFEALLASFGTR